MFLCVTDERNQARPQGLTAATIGLTVTLLISLLGPLTMACFNPVRDFAIVGPLARLHDDRLDLSGGLYVEPDAALRPLEMVLRVWCTRPRSPGNGVEQGCTRKVSTCPKGRPEPEKWPRNGPEKCFSA